MSVTRSVRQSYALPSSSKGMTLLELVVVVVLIGGLLAVLSSRLMGSKTRAEYKLAQTQLMGLSQKIEQFQVDLGRYPENLDELVSPPVDSEGWLGPYAKAGEFKDPWGSAIEYELDTKSEQAQFVLRSLAADRKTGGEGVDKDITALP